MPRLFWSCMAEQKEQVEQCGRGLRWAPQRLGRRGGRLEHEARGYEELAQLADRVRLHARDRRVVKRRPTPALAPHGRGCALRLRERLRERELPAREPLGQLGGRARLARPLLILRLRARRCAGRSHIFAQGRQRRKCTRVTRARRANGCSAYAPCARARARRACTARDRAHTGEGGHPREAAQIGRVEADACGNAVVEQRACANRHLRERARARDGRDPAAAREPAGAARAGKRRGGLGA